MVTWGATNTDAILNGSQDAYITAQAKRLRDLNSPVFLRYFHEPDGAVAAAPEERSTSVVMRCLPGSSRSGREVGR